MNDYQSLKLNLGLMQIDMASLLRQKIVPYLYWWSDTTIILAITTSIKLAILKMSKTRSNEKTKKRKYCLDDDEKVDDDREKSLDFKKIFKCWLNKKTRTFSEQIKKYFCFVLILF